MKINGLPKRILIGLVFLGTTCVSMAQISVSQFIGSALKDPEVKTFDEKVSYLQRKPYRLSPLKEVEFRTQNRELLYTQQEYAIRLSPANPWEVRSNNRYFKAFETSLTMEREMVLKEALTERYYTLIEYLYYHEWKELSARSQLQLENQLAILDKQTGSTFFDADELVKVRIDQMDNSAQLEEISYDLSNLQHRISRLFPEAHRKETNWKLKDTPEMEQIKSICDSLALASYESVAVSYQQQKINLAKSEYALEKSNMNLGFFQTSYDRRRVNQDRTPYSISLGLNIPITNPNKGDMAKAKLDIIEAEYDLEETTREGETDRIIFEDKIAGLYNRYISLMRRVDELNNSNFAQTLSQIKGGDPLMLVKFNEQMLRLEVLLLKIRRDTLFAYIDYLAFTDKLQQRPLVNFLSPVLAPAE